MSKLSIIERDAMREGAKAAVSAVFDKAEQIYGREFERPTVVFDTKGRTAGYAAYGPWEIRVNEVLYHENIAQYLTNTIPHEVAHLVAYRLYDNKNQKHNENWRQVAISLGCDGKRCHSYSTKNSRTKVKRWHYICGQCAKIFKLSTVRHNKIQRTEFEWGCTNNHEWQALFFTGRMTTIGGKT